MIEGITPREAAKMLKVSPWTIYEAVRMLELPHYRFGKKIIIDKGDLEKWINEKKVGG